MRSLTLLIALVLALLAGPGHALEEPAAFTARYSIHADGLKVGELKREQKAVGADRYVLKTEMYTTGLVSLFKDDRFVERSLWELRDGRPVPLDYLYLHTDGENETLERLDFQWPEQRVISLRDGEETPVPVEPGVLDKLMYQVVLKRDLEQGMREMTYQVADRGDIRDYRFRLVGDEQLVTDVGTLRTLKVERISNDRKRKTTLWCAPALDYMVVQLEQQDDGHTFASYILETSQKAKPVFQNTTQ